MAQAFGSNLPNVGAFIACFQSPLKDLESQTVLGNGIDCLWEYGNMTTAVAAIAFFAFDCNSTLIHSGLTSTGGFTADVGTGPIDKGGPSVDTMSGALPVEGGNTILPGTGDYASASGTVRLSGALHLNTEPWFNCIWDILITTTETPTCGVTGSASSSSALMTASGPSPNFGVVNFLGQAEDLGSLDAANQLMGTNVTFEQAHPGVVTSQFLGCQKVDMVDLMSKQSVGTGIDCLWAIAGLDFGIAAIAFFGFKDKGSIVNSGLTSIAPFTDGVSNNPVAGPGSPNAAVVSGSFPPAVDGDTFVQTTGMYADWKGTVRLSGAATPGAPFWFNCIWQIYVEKPTISTTTGGGTTPTSTTSAAAAGARYLGTAVATFVGGAIAILWMM